MSRMAPDQRTHMIDWLALERPGDGKPMPNWRWIYGGAAKGQNMNGDASDVHASSGNASLAKYVNEKSQIKCDKERAWTSETAEKRWTYLKGLYRKAVFLPAPDPINNDEYESECQLYAEKQEKVCGGFARLHKLLKDHPSTQPKHVADTMEEEPEKMYSDDGLDSSDDADGDDVPESGSKRSSAQSKTKTKQGTTPADKSRKLTKQDAAAKKPFHLKKPVSEASHKRTDIQTLFINSQSELARGQDTQMRVNAVLGLMKEGLTPEQMKPYLSIMFKLRTHGLDVITDKRRVVDDDPELDHEISTSRTLTTEQDRLAALARCQHSGEA